MFKEKRLPQPFNLAELYRCDWDQTAQAAVNFQRANDVWQQEFEKRRPSPNTLRALSLTVEAISHRELGYPDKKPTAEYLASHGCEYRDHGSFSEIWYGNPDKAEIMLVLSHTGTRLSPSFLHTLNMSKAKEAGMDDFQQMAAIIEQERDRGLCAMIPFFIEYCQAAGYKNAYIFISETARAFSDFNRVEHRMSSAGGLTKPVSLKTTRNGITASRWSLGNTGSSHALLNAGMLEYGSLTELRAANPYYEQAEAFHVALQVEAHNFLQQKLQTAKTTLHGVIIPHSMDNMLTEDQVPTRPGISLLAGASLLHDAYYYLTAKQAKAVLHGLIEVLVQINKFPSNMSHSVLIREISRIFEEKGEFGPQTIKLVHQKLSIYQEIAQFLGIDYPYRGHPDISAGTVLVRENTDRSTMVIPFEIRKDTADLGNQGHLLVDQLTQTLVNCITEHAMQKSSQGNRGAQKLNQIYLATQNS